MNREARFPKVADGMLSAPFKCFSLKSAIFWQERRYFPKLLMECCRHLWICFCLKPSPDQGKASLKISAAQFIDLNFRGKLSIGTGISFKQKHIQSCRQLWDILPQVTFVFEKPRQVPGPNWWYRRCRWWYRGFIRGYSQIAKDWRVMLTSGNGASL